MTLHRILWFWDGTPLLDQSSEWWRPWEFWPLSITGILGLLLILTRRPRGWPLLAAGVLVCPIPYHPTYAVSTYRHAIEPRLLLLSCYLLFVLRDEFRPAARAPVDAGNRSAADS